jgi:predicted pyridoxine 5'-phosphate oxidase superfamily flavin-nucleotide-binding protein
MPRPPYPLPSTVDPHLAELLAAVDTAYLATASRDGEPYAQHRGGPPGFVIALDERTLGIPDFAGNRQLLTVQNLADNDRVFLFLMDYARRRRAKIWGRARVTTEPELVARVTPAGYRARVERAIVVTIDGWDLNCPAHIPIKLAAADVSAAIDRLEQRIASLEAENQALRRAAAG